MAKTPRKAPRGGFREHPENINRAGRKPNSKTLGDYLREWMEAETEDGKKQIVETLMDVAMKKARQGQFQFWDALMNRAYGKPAEHIEVTPTPAFDASKLSDDELAALKALLEKAKP